MRIRRGEEKDIPQIETLLYQVHKVHSDGRPDLFVVGAKKYGRQELVEILADDTRPVYVAEENGEILSYAFCILQEQTARSMYPHKSIYIDDLCVSQSCRGRHIGTELYDHVVAVAKEAGCYSVTLNVWACNEPALHFYQKQGMQIQKYVMEAILEE